MATIPFDAPSFSLSGTPHVARVVSLHDGDTFTVVLSLGGAYYKFNVRLDGIDTPEMTSRDPVLKSRAFLARARLFSLITNRNTIDTLTWRKKDFDTYFLENYTTVTLECKDMDKYGRVLASISNFAQVLIDEKHAIPYDGGHKAPF